MGYLTFEDLEKKSNKFSKEQKNQIGFFSLANGETATVRFNIGTREDFEMLAIHEIPVNGKTRKISCLGDNCAVCNSNIQFKNNFGQDLKSSTVLRKVYIQLLQYKQNSDGTVTVEPKIWERPTTTAEELRSFLDGGFTTLRDTIFSVTRRGDKLDTKYTFVPQMIPGKYPDNVFVKDFSAFDGYHALGTIVLNKTAEEFKTYLETGSFPFKDNKVVSSASYDVNTGFMNLPPQTDDVPVWSAEKVAEATPVQPQMPWDVAPQNGGFVQQAPRREVQQVPWEAQQTSAPSQWDQVMANASTPQMPQGQTMDKPKRYL